MKGIYDIVYDLLPNMPHTHWISSDAGIIRVKLGKKYLNAKIQF